MGWMPGRRLNSTQVRVSVQEAKVIKKQKKTHISLATLRIHSNWTMRHSSHIPLHIDARKLLRACDGLTLSPREAPTARGIRTQGLNHATRSLVPVYAHAD